MTIAVHAAQMQQTAVPLRAFGPDGAFRFGADAPTIRLLRRDQEVFAEGEAADHFYEVIAGAVRTYKLLADGRRQINAFHLHGTMFGIEAGAEHRFCAEAIGAVTLRVYKRWGLEALVAQDPALACRVVDAVASALQRAQDHMLLLGRKSAREKVASFLLDLLAQGPASDRIDVPMPRSDMADHLGLQIETVSRTLTQLQREGLIDLPASRVIRIVRLAALRQVAGGEGCDAGALPGPARTPGPQAHRGPHPRPAH